MFKSHKLRILLMLIFLAFAGITAMGQPSDPITGGTEVGGDEDVPLDGGILALIAGGAAMLYSQFACSKKKKK